ncbi:uncharacterized protein LOC135841226 [Planococcus citri]|uniref:uncharacterized protein LOC135841226 n=1 Tax=Planococcus citri TaxID=170843 RepID=UPI0031F9DC14
MSCSAGPSYTPDDIEKWSLNVNVVLDSPRGRRKFKEFLSEWDLEDDEKTLQFWEKCNALLHEAHQNKHLKKHDKAAKIHHDRFEKEAIALVEYAEEHLNFDVAQLREFRQIVEKKDVQQTLKVISRAQSTASYLLKSKFELFRKKIQKELPPLNAKKK